MNKSTWTPTAPTVAPDNLTFDQCLAEKNGVFGQGSTTAVLVVIAGLAFTLGPIVGAAPSLIPATAPAAGTLYRDLDPSVPSSVVPPAPDTLTLAQCIAKVDGVFGTGNDNPVLVMLGGCALYRDPASPNGQLAQSFPPALNAPGVLFHELSGTIEIDFAA